MDDAATMSEIERAAGLDYVADLRAERQRRLASDQLLQALAFQILHRYKWGAAGFGHFVNGDDIGVLQASSSPGLAVKALQQIDTFSHAGRDRLHGHGASNERITPLEHYAHGPAADLLQDFVSSDLLHG